MIVYGVYVCPDNMYVEGIDERDGSVVLNAQHSHAALAADWEDALRLQKFVLAALPGRSAGIHPFVLTENGRWELWRV